MRRRSWRVRLGWFTAVSLAFMLTTGTVLAFEALRDKNEVPDTFVLPAPQPGDAATYAVAVERLDARYAPVPYEPLGVTARWMPAKWQADRHGVEHWVAPLALEFRYHFDPPHDYRSAVVQEVWFDIADWRVLGVHQVEEFHDAFEEEAQDGWAALTFLDEPHAPCGFLTALHGAPANRPSDREVPAGGCDSDRGLRARDFVRRDGIDAIRFQAGGTRIEYNPATPWPLTIEDRFTSLLEAMKTTGSRFTWNLTGSVEGDGDYAPRPPRGSPDPPVAMVPAAPRPDDGGLGLNFSLTDALAILDAEDDQWQTWWETYDLHIVQAYQARWTQDDGDPVERWRLTATDGDAWISREVTQITELPKGYLAALQTPSTTTTWDAWLRTFDRPISELYPTPEQLPADAPDIAAILAGYAQHGGDGEPGDWWGFFHVCETPQPGCGDVSSRFFAGEYTPDAPRPNTLPGSLTEGPRDRAHHRAGWDADGHLSYLRVQYNERPGYAVVTLPGGGEATIPVPPAIQLQSAEIPQDGAVAGAIPLAAGTGFLAAILVALWKWTTPVRAAMTAKRVAGLGLFSRITTGAVLRNPNRESVHDVIVADPGIHFQELLRRTGQASGALEHHLGKLVATGLVTAHVGAGYTCYFAAGTDRRIMAAAPALKSPAARRLHSAVKDAGDTGLGTRAAAEAAGVAVGTASHHLKRLADAGVIEGGGRAGWRARFLP